MRFNRGGLQPFADNFAERCKTSPKMRFNSGTFACLIKIASLEIPRLKCDLGVGEQPFADNFAKRCKTSPKMRFNRR